MRPPFAPLAVLALAAPLAACGHARPATTATPAAYSVQANSGAALVASAQALGGRCVTGFGDVQASRASNLLLPDQVPGAGSLDLHTVVTRHRALWLVTRGTSSLGAGQPVVYVDDVRYGGVETLRGVTASSVRLARFLSGPQAHLKYGVNHAEGAIELYTSCPRALPVTPSATPPSARSASPGGPAPSSPAAPSRRAAARCRRAPPGRRCRCRRGSR